MTGRNCNPAYVNHHVGDKTLVQLARQEIAAKLNIANGADGSCVEQTLAAVDSLIGNLVIPPVGNGRSASHFLCANPRGLQRRRFMCSSVRVASLTTTTEPRLPLRDHTRHKPRGPDKGAQLRLSPSRM